MAAEDRQLLLLGLLRRQEMHGYQLNEFLGRDLSMCSDLKKPTAYFLLGKMAESGWVTQEETREGNRPPRRVYRITPEGEQAFQQMLRANLGSHESVYFADDVGLALMDTLAPAEARTLLKNRRAAAAKTLAALQATPVHTGSIQLVIEHQIRHLTSELTWLDEVIERLSGQTF
jgi:DNA-binding PadR family transcriptional regulator